MPVCNQKSKTVGFMFSHNFKAQTDQINLTASNLEKNSVAHRICAFFLKGRLLKSFPVLVPLSHMCNTITKIFMIFGQLCQV
jgi:hypothetical protein